MFNIRNSHEARQGYKMLSIFYDPNFRAQHHYTDMLDDEIIKLKRNLRKWANKGPEQDVGLGFMVERRIVKDDGDACTELVTIPEEFTTEAEADEFFKDFMVMHYQPSMYDCTGQLFTAWYKLFKRNGRYYAYHRICMDV